MRLGAAAVLGATVGVVLAALRRARLLDAAGNPRVQMIDSSRGIANPAATEQERHRPQGLAHLHGAQNHHIWLDPLRALDREIASELRPYRGKTFVAFHDVAPFFAERYDLRAVAVVDVPELSPSPADLQRVIAEVRRSQLKALLREPQ